MACSCENKFADVTEYINEVITAEHPQSTLISVLHFAQEKYGYLSNELIEHIAQISLIPAAEIYGVATFYGYFKLTPQGKHHISICMGTACYIRGAGKIVEILEEELEIKVGETTSDNLFTLDETRCIGACGLAPVMVIDDKVYGRLEPHQIKGILDTYKE